jgi:prepilin-type processing-associated H-X9-DG protein
MLPMGQINTLHTQPTAPPAELAPWERIGWAVLILPYIEQDNLRTKVKEETRLANNYSLFQPSAKSKVPVYICPADNEGGRVASEGFQMNYLGCFGNTIFSAPTTDGTNGNGVLYPMSRVKLAGIEDGTSNQLLCSETVMSSPSAGDDRRGRLWNCWQGETLFSTLYPPNNTIADVCYSCPGVANPRAPCTAIGSGNGAIQSARSMHSGGVNTVFADGSVHYITNSIDTTTWLLLGSRNDQQVLPTSGF